MVCCLRRCVEVKKISFFIQNVAFFGKPLAVNVLTQCQKISCNACNDSINVFRDLSEQNKFFKIFLGVELTRSLPTSSILVVTIEIYRTS